MYRSVCRPGVDLTRFSRLYRRIISLDVPDTSAKPSVGSLVVYVRPVLTAAKILALRRPLEPDGGHALHSQCPSKVGFSRLSPLSFVS